MRHRVKPSQDLVSHEVITLDQTASVSACIRCQHQNFVRDRSMT